MNYCKSCGQEITNPDAVICPNCGCSLDACSTAVVAPSCEPAKKFCACCGNEVSADAIMCVSCGSSLKPSRCAKVKGANDDLWKSKNILKLLSKVFLDLVMIGSCLMALVGLVMAVVSFVGGTLIDPNEILYILGIYDYVIDTTIIGSFAALIWLPFIFAPAWVLPISIITLKSINNRRPVSLTMKILVLLLVNPLVGIMLFFDKN